MELHKLKNINFGVGILSPEHNIGSIMCTARSIKNNYPGVTFICSVTKDVSQTDMKEIGNICPVYKGKDTITSLMNVAMRRGHKEWNLLVMAGAIVRPGIIRKFSLFLENETDVLFPIVMEYNRKGEPTVIKKMFHDATLNGTFIHQKLFKTVGDFSDHDSIMDSKLWWAGQAIEHGAKFKSILGAKLI